MNSCRMVMAAAAALLVTSGIAGCVVAGDGYEGNVGASYGVNYYEPFDNNGWWGPGYLVGPSRGDRDRSRYDAGARAHAWHAEPGSGHSMPSLPHGRPGGSGGGGGHGGGHEGGHH